MTKHELRKVENYPKPFDYGIDDWEVIGLTKMVFGNQESEWVDTIEELKDDLDLRIEVIISELLERIYWWYVHATSIYSYRSDEDTAVRLEEKLIKEIEEWDELIEKEQRIVRDSRSD